MHVDDHVDSPCINVCTIAADGFCMGCKRSIDEIAYWPHMTGDEKRYVLTLLEQRKPRLTPIPTPVPGSE